MCIFTSDALYVDEDMYVDVGPYSTNESDASIVVFHVIVVVDTPGVPELTEEILGPVLSVVTVIVVVAWLPDESRATAEMV